LEKHREAVADAKEAIRYDPQLAKGFLGQCYSVLRVVTNANLSILRVVTNAILVIRFSFV